MSLPDPIVDHCVNFLEAMLDGEEDKLSAEWENIRQRRDELGLKKLDFWEPVWHDIEERCKQNHLPVDSMTIAMLVSNIKDWDEPDLTKLNYYEECQENKPKLVVPENKALRNIVRDSNVDIKKQLVNDTKVSESDLTDDDRFRMSRQKNPVLPDTKTISALNNPYFITK